MTGAQPITDDVVRAACGGDVAAQAQVLGAVAVRAGQMALARLAATPDRFNAAEEVAQDSLRALSRGLPRLRERTVRGLNGLLSTIVARRIALHVRRGARRRRRGWVSLDSTGPALTRGGPLWELLSASGVSPRTGAEQLELVEQALAAVARLPDRQRAAVTMAVFDQLATQEIATRLTITRPAASMLILRGLRTLRRELVGTTGSTAGTA